MKNTIKLLSLFLFLPFLNFLNCEGIHENYEEEKNYMTQNTIQNIVIDSQIDGKTIIKLQDGGNNNINVTKKATSMNKLSCFEVQIVETVETITIKIIDLVSSIRFGSRSVEIEVLLANRCDIELTTSFDMDIDIDGAAKNANIQISDGITRITDTQGDIIVTKYDGESVFHNIDGKTELAVNEGDIEIKDGTGPVTIAQTCDGNITVTDISSSTSITTMDGSAQLTNIAGDVTIEKQDGNSILTNIAANIELSADTGSVDINSLNKSLIISKGDGDIDITVASAYSSYYDISNSGNITFNLSYTPSTSTTGLIGNDSTTANSLDINIADGSININD